MIAHFAVVVSAKAERDVDKGFRKNLNCVRTLIHAIRLTERRSGYFILNNRKSGFSA